MRSQRHLQGLLGSETSFDSETRGNAMDAGAGDTAIHGVLLSRCRVRVDSWSPFCFSDGVSPDRERLNLTPNPSGHGNCHGSSFTGQGHSLNGASGQASITHSWGSACLSWLPGSSSRRRKKCSNSSGPAFDPCLPSITLQVSLDPTWIEPGDQQILHVELNICSTIRDLYTAVEALAPIPGDAAFESFELRVGFPGTALGRDGPAAWVTLEEGGLCSRPPPRVMMRRTMS